MTYERDLYMRRQEQDHDLLGMRTRWPSRDSDSRPTGPRPERARVEDRQSGGSEASASPNLQAENNP